MNNETTSQEQRSLSLPKGSPKTVKKNYSKFSKRPHLAIMGKRNNEGTFKNSTGFMMLPARNYGAIYTPQRKKLKGYEKENRRYNRKTA